MNQQKALELLSDLIEELDYDLWKGIFFEDAIEDPDANEEFKKTLLAILKKHKVKFD